MHAYIPQLFIATISSVDPGTVVKARFEGPEQVREEEGTIKECDRRPLIYYISRSQGLLPLTDSIDINPAEDQHLKHPFTVTKTHHILFPLVIVAPAGFNAELLISVDSNQRRGTALCRILCKKGLRCQSLIVPNVVKIECLKEVHVPIVMRSIAQGIELTCEFFKKSDHGNLLFDDPVPKDIDCELLLADVQSHTCVKALIDAGIKIKSNVPIDVEGPTSKYAHTEIVSPPLIIKTLADPELCMGQTGSFKFEIDQKLSSIPVKVAYRLLSVDKGYLLSGTIAGMKTLLPGKNEMSFDLVPVYPGWLKTPGIEFECLPGGERVKFDAGATVFVHPGRFRVEVHE